MLLWLIRLPVSLCWGYKFFIQLKVKSRSWIAKGRDYTGYSLFAPLPSRPRSIPCPLFYMPQDTDFMDSIIRVPLPYGFELGLAKGRQQQSIGRWEEKEVGVFILLLPPLLGHSFWLYSMVTVSVHSSFSLTPNFFQAPDTLFSNLAP